MIFHAVQEITVLILSFSLYNIKSLSVCINAELILNGFAGSDLTTASPTAAESGENDIILSVAS